MDKQIDLHEDKLTNGGAESGITDNATDTQTNRQMNTKTNGQRNADKQIKRIDKGKGKQRS